MAPKTWALGALLCSSLAVSSPALADDWTITAHVTEVEVTYVPDSILFKIDQAAGTCAAGSQLTWNAHGSTDTKQAANTAAATSALTTSVASGKNIKIIGNNANCVVNFMYLET